MNLKEFVNPPKRYRPCPIWSWNSTMEPSEIENRVREMKRKGFGAFVIQARHGLKTTYMEDDWMRAVRRAVETARETELECWFHDDDRSPSGSAAGAITADKAENIAMALLYFEDAVPYKEQSGDIILGYVSKNADGVSELIDEAPESLKDTGIFIARRAESGQPRYHGAAYADLLNPDTARAFIDAVHERYAKLFRYDFGEFLPGIFTSGATIERDGAMFGGIDDSKVISAWTPSFPEFFFSHYGYRPEKKLPLLLTESSEASAFRKELEQTLEELFIKSFSIAIGEWCSEHDFKSAGYAGSEGTNRSAHSEYFDIPAVEAVTGQAEDMLSLKMASGTANQLGKQRVVAECFAGIGNDASYLDLKRIADLAFVNGATMIAPTFAQYSLLGDRKRDFPPTFSYHQYHWEHIRALNDYIGRCAWAVSTGSKVAEVLVAAPDSTGDTVDENALAKICEALTEQHISFDIANERIMKRHGKAGEKDVTIGNASYSLVILPQAAGWRLSTLDLLEKFQSAVMVAGTAPSVLDKDGGDRMKTFLGRSTVSTVNGVSALIENVISQLPGRTKLTADDVEKSSEILVTETKEAGARLLFLINTNKDSSCEIEIDVAAIGGVVELDALSGRAFRYASEIKDGRTVIKTKIEAAGSRIFLIDQTQTSTVHMPVASDEEPLSIEGPYSFQRNHENTLTIDRCTLTIDGKTVLENAALNEVKQAVWHRTGIDEYLECQPWYISQRNVRTRTNRTVLTFTFNVTQAPSDISLAMESADRYEVRINGSKIETTPGKWYLDKRLPVLDLEGHVIEGENTITAETDYLWDTEIENIYLIGDFTVGSAKDGFPIMAEGETIDSGSWTEQGYPFYPGSITYRMEFGLEFAENEFFELDLSGIEACNSYVTVNGSDIGSLPFPPYRADISGALQQGSNNLEIEVFGTLGNLLPGNSGEENESKRFRPYGLIKPPRLIKIIEK